MSIWILCLLLAGPWAADGLADEPAAGGIGGRAPTPPGQPEHGPGGREYRYKHVAVASYGHGADQVWVFQPRGAEKKQQPLPVVLYVHGLNLPHYGVSRQWIEHLVRRGNIVIYPRYQHGAIVDPEAFTDVTAKATRLALAQCNGNQHPPADTERFAMAGHSIGGTIILNLAARPEHFGLPVPKALMPIMPGDVRVPSGIGAFMPKAAEDHSTVAAGTLMLVVAGQRDRFVGTRFAERIYRDTKNIPPQDKDLLLIGDDDHGEPALSADHFMPLAYESRSGLRQADAYDFALWRWFDALSDAAFYDGKHREIALGNTPQQHWMGDWSDGRKVRPPEIWQPAEAEDAP